MVYVIFCDGLKLGSLQANKSFTKAIWDYLDSAASDSRIRNGKAALRKHAGTLDAIEARYGVDKEVVVAVWGLESAFGAVRGASWKLRGSTVFENHFPLPARYFVR